MSNNMHDQPKVVAVSTLQHALSWHKLCACNSSVKL